LRLGCHTFKETTHAHPDSYPPRRRPGRGGPARTAGAGAGLPSRPIKILVGFGAGGTTDSVARLYGQKMSEVLNAPVIIDNKPGANQITAIRALMAAPPDGYTLYAATPARWCRTRRCGPTCPMTR
jgi:hypothetical protein